MLFTLENLTGELGVLAAKFSDEPLMKLHSQVRTMAIYWSLLGLLLIAIASLIAAQLLTRRLYLITHAAEAVANGDMNARANVDGGDEVAELGTIFDTMVHKINAGRSQLEERERFLSLTLDSIGDAVIITDERGVITRMNPVAEVLTGWTNTEAYGQPLPEVFHIINADTKRVAPNPVDQVLKSGKLCELDSHTSLIDKSGYERQISDSVAPIIDVEGWVLGTILVFRDVTQQQKVEETLRRSQKMDAIGQLSGGISHDFNNQLSIVIGYLDYLGKLFSEGEKPHKWVKTASNATLRCIDLTRQLLSFSRRQASEVTALNLNSAFDDLCEMISRSVTPEIDVQYVFADDLWITDANRGEFQDVIINLVINARDAMPQGGHIIIETANICLDEVSSDPNLGLMAGEHVSVAVSDNGTGMDKATQDKMFEPFFTTKEKGKGTGHGNSMGLPNAIMAKSVSIQSRGLAPPCVYTCPAQKAIQ